MKPKREQVHLNQSDLRRQCKWWQGILRLSDWDTEVRVVRASGLSGDSQGEIIPFAQKRVAKVKILDPVDFCGETIIPQDMEVTLVHELLHLYFLPFSIADGSPLDLAQEQAIDALSVALVSLSRGTV